MKIYFRKHVLQRMKERLYTVDEIVDCVTKGAYFFEGSKGKELKYSSVYKGVRVVLYENRDASQVHVVTVTPSQLKTNELHREKKAKNTTIKKILMNEKGIDSAFISKEIKELNLYNRPLVI